MGRPPRVAVGGMLYHVLNRANSRLTIFETDGDYKDFEEILEKTCADQVMRVLAYSLMPNHWHMVLWPRRDGELSSFIARLTTIHTHRRQAYLKQTGEGHLYQGRFKSFPVQNDNHLLTVCRYVERNPLRARLVLRAEDWRWGSLWRRERGGEKARKLLCAWPVSCPGHWLEFVNDREHEAVLEDLRESNRRGRPFGCSSWVEDLVQRFGLQFRDRGRPCKL